MSTKVYGYTRKDKIQNDCIREDIGVTTIEEKMTKNQLKWFWIHTEKATRNMSEERGTKKDVQKLEYTR